MAVTIKDIARALGISAAAVSMALNDSHMVSQETRQRVKETAQQMGYVRNRYARGLVRGRSGSIALVVPDIVNVYFADLVKQVTSLASDYDVVISITNESVEAEWRTLRYLTQQRVEAILLAPVNRPIEDEAYIAWLEACPVPIVFTSARHPGVARPCVMSDLRSGMRALTEHVIAAGARTTALLTGPKGVQTLGMREAGYAEALEAFGRAGDVWRVDEVTYHNAFGRVRDAADAALPEALICINDMMAIGALNALNARGLTPPRDLMVTGFDNSIFSQVATVPLTTVHQDVARIAGRAVEIALELIEGKAAGDEIVDCTLVARESTRR
jgi:LacI family transcriptional regulator